MTTNIKMVDENGVAYGVKKSGDAMSTCPEEHHTSYSEEYTADAGGDITATTVITPSSGLKLSIHVFQIQTDGSSGVVNLDFVTSSIKVGRLYASKNTSFEVSQDHSEGAVDEVLTISASGIGNSSKVFLKIQYIEE